MALDTGIGPDEFRTHADWKDMTSPIVDAPSLGAGLRAARLASGRSLGALSIDTRVNTRYLNALEEGDFSALPSRVFAIGYVRAYAGALGLDEQLAVERFKLESPDQAAALQAPVGIAFEDVRRRSKPVLAALAVVGLAVIGWNIFQHLNLRQALQPSDIASVPESWSLGAVPGQTGTPLAISGPNAAPPDQTTPEFYVTPGLEAQLLGAQSEEQLAAAAMDNTPVQAAFNPRGAIYGAAAMSSQVVIQAKKPSPLVVRMADGRILFARQLASGEAWRAPMGLVATIDVSDPTAFDVYLNGEHGGALGGLLTPLAQLNARAEVMARQAAAQAAAQSAAQSAAQAAALSAARAAANPGAGRQIASNGARSATATATP